MIGGIVAAGLLRILPDQPWLSLTLPLLSTAPSFILLSQRARGELAGGSDDSLVACHLHGAHHSSGITETTLRIGTDKRDVPFPARATATYIAGTTP